MRSILTLTAIVVTTSACLAPPLPIGSSDDEAGECADTATVDDDTTESSDTDTTEAYPTSDPCEVSLRWGAQYTETTINDFDLPSLMVTSTCELEIGLRGIGLKVMGGAWIGQLPDTRLGIGDGDIQPLGVYTGTISEYGIKAEWSASVDDYNIYFSPTRPVDVGLTLAAFTSWSEEMAALDELKDATPDTISVQATIVFNADGQAGGALVDTTTVVIFPE